MKLISAKKPYAPAPYEPSHAEAVQMLSKGECPPHLQINFLKWLINDVCRTTDQSYRPDSDRDTVFAEGKRFVGNTLIKMGRLIPSNIVGGSEEHG